VDWLLGTRAGPHVVSTSIKILHTKYRKLSG